ncbi:MAG: GNAT family N-acetyltransferase [Alphaproteobacteria bacterium]|nr:GNAT family N-acetyltransferase [Alphaproteobacteria bacterium]
MRPFPPTRLEGDGFVVRPWRLDEALGVNAAVNASLDHLRPWMAWAQSPNTLDHTEEHLRKAIGAWHLDEDFLLGIFASDDRTCIGGTGFHPRGGFRGPGTTEIGMWIHVDHAGQGLATRVLEALLVWGFTDWWWARIEWRCDADNHASAAVARKAGMVYEGTLRSNLVGVDGARRDTMVFALLRDEVGAVGRR